MSVSSGNNRHTPLLRVALASWDEGNSHGPQLQWEIQSNKMGVITGIW